MKRYMIINLLVTVCLLSACGIRQQIKLPAKTQNTISSSSALEEKNLSGKELFSDFIEAYEQDSFADGMDYPPQKNHYKQYAFYDINQDGVDELLIGEVQSDGTIYLATLFHQEDLTKESQRKFLMYHYGGSYRGSFQLYTDGTILWTTWIPISGEGTATTYHINDTSTDIVEDRVVEVQMPGDNPAELLGLSSVTSVDLTSLTWYNFKIPDSALDLDALSQGNFTSLVGQWRNKDGDILSIDENGKVQGGSSITFSHSIFVGQALKGSIGAGATLFVVPKNVEVGQLFPNGVDLSDMTRERLLINPEVAGYDNAYYRVIE